MVHKLDCLQKLEKIIDAKPELDDMFGLGLAIQNSDCYKCKIQATPKCEPFKLLEHYRLHRVVKDTPPIKEVNINPEYLVMGGDYSWVNEK